MAVVEDAASLRQPLPIPYFSLFEPGTTKPIILGKPQAEKFNWRPITLPGSVNKPLYTPQAAMEKFISGLTNDVKNALKEYADKIKKQFGYGAKKKETIDTLDDGSLGAEFFSPPGSTDSSDENTAKDSIKKWASWWESEGEGSEAWNNVGSYVDEQTID